MTFYVFLMYPSEHFTLLFMSSAGGELLLWGQIPCVSWVSDQPGLKRLWTPQPVPLADRRVGKHWTNDVFRLLCLKKIKVSGFFSVKELKLDMHTFFKGAH